jgi:hypothetical protein
MVKRDTDAPLMVAAATVDLTPPAGLPMAGYVLRAGGVASGTHDALLGSLVWVRGRGGGDGDVLWVALDATAVDAELAAAIAAAVAEAAGCAARAVRVCASHSHSSAAGWLRGVSPYLPESGDEKLRRTLIAQLADAARALPPGLEPCWPLLGQGQAPSAGGNRNDPAGPHDSSVGILGLIGADGRLTAAVVDYASHATVLGHDNFAWSADWPGAARRVLAAALSSASPFPPSASTADTPRRGPVIAFLQGAAGDASPRWVRRSQGFEEAERLGGLVAAAALAGLFESAPVAGAMRVAVRQRVVSLATRRLPDAGEVQRRVAETEAAWRAAQSAGAPAGEERVARTRHEGALMLRALSAAGLPSAIECPISVVAVSGGAWVHLPVELFASLGLAIRAESPFRWTRVIGYSDAYLGYVADRAAHRDGVYEALASPFDPAAGDALVEAAVGLLGEAAALVAEPATAPASELVQ